ncbi:MAG: hypothetical protein AABY50_09145 [Nitrospirota bacterium]
MHLKATIRKWLKLIGGDSRQAIVGYIVVALILASGGILSLSKTALNIFLQIVNIPTPLWATTLLLLLCGLYSYLKQRKNPESYEPPNYKLCYFTIGNYKWEVKVYKSGYFKVNEYPFCVKHDLRFIFGSNEKYCPGTENERCNNNLPKYDEFKVFEAAKSIIENKIRNKQC